jgi:hypothetical protein
MQKLMERTLSRLPVMANIEVRSQDISKEEMAANVAAASPTWLQARPANRRSGNETSGALAETTGNTGK